MQLIVYAAPLNMIGHNLVKGLHAMPAPVELCTFGDIASLIDHLRKPMGGTSICILIPSDHHELLRLNAIRHLMRDMRLILILPDRQAETVSDGHSLRPRFVSYIDCPWTDVISVVRKMIDSSRSLEQVGSSRCVSS